MEAWYTCPLPFARIVTIPFNDKKSARTLSGRTLHPSPGLLRKLRLQTTCGSTVVTTRAATAAMTATRRKLKKRTKNQRNFESLPSAHITSSAALSLERKRRRQRQEVLLATPRMLRVSRASCRRRQTSALTCYLEQVSGKKGSLQLPVTGCTNRSCGFKPPLLVGSARLHQRQSASALYVEWSSTCCKAGSTRLASSDTRGARRADGWRIRLAESDKLFLEENKLNNSVRTR